jgi:hypothetical protein
MYSRITYNKMPLATFGFIGLSTVVLAAMIFRDTKTPAPEKTQEPVAEPQPPPVETQEPVFADETADILPPDEKISGGKRKTKGRKQKKHHRTKRR